MCVGPTSTLHREWDRYREELSFLISNDTLWQLMIQKGTLTAEVVVYSCTSVHLAWGGSGVSFIISENGLGGTSGLCSMRIII
jgi:hypothetical protein